MAATEVYRSLTGTGFPDTNPSDWTLVETVADGILTYTDSSLAFSADRWYVTRAQGGSVWSNRRLVTPLQPSATFSADPIVGEAPLSVTFTRDPLPGRPASYSWRINGVEFSAAEEPTHEFTDVGEYDITLVVVNSSGTATSTRFGYISVLSSTPDFMRVTAGADERVAADGGFRVVVE